MHHARWMSKIIYAFKIYLFRDFIVLTDAELNGLLLLCQFLLLIYVKYWFLCPLSTSAPANDLQLLKDLHEYKLVNADIAKAVLKKHLNHLWYLSDKLICLSVFDGNLTTAELRALAHAILHSKKHSANADKATVKESQITTLTLKRFVTKASITFKVYNINISLLRKDPATWKASAMFTPVPDSSAGTSRSCSVLGPVTQMARRSFFLSLCLVIPLSFLPSQCTVRF